MACYLGEVLRDRDADERGKTNGDDYLFGLDFAKHETGRGGTCWDSNFGFNGNNNDNISAEATGEITSPIVISDPLPPEEQNGRTCRPDSPISKPLLEGGEDEDTSHSVSQSSELLSKGERERRKSHPVAAAAATESVARQSTAVSAGLAASPGEKVPPSGKAASTVAVAVARANGRAPPADASLPKVCDLRDFFSRGAPTGSGGSVSKGCVSNGKKSGENAGRTQPGDRRGSAGKSCVGDEKSCGEGTEGTQLRLTAAAAAAVVALPVATSHRDPARETPTKTAVESLPSPKAPPSPGGMSTPLQRFMEKSGCKDASQAAPFMRGANGDVDAALETYFRVFPPKSCPAATNVPPKPRSAAMDVSLKSPSVAMDISPDSRPVAMDVEESIDCRMDVEKNSDHPKKDACKGSGEAEVGVGADASTKNVESLDFDLEGAAGGGTASAATGSGERVEMMTIVGVGCGGGGSGGTSPEKTLRHLSGDALVAWRAEWNRREREAYRREREEELEDTVMPDTTNADSTENVKGAPPPRPGLHAAGDRDRRAGDTILGDETPGDKSAGCTSPGDKTAGDTRAGDKPANDTTPGDEPAGDTTPGDKSAGGTKNLAAAVSPSLKTEGGRPTSPTLLKKEMGMSGSAIEVLAQELDDSFVDGSSAETAWVIDEHSSEVPTPCWANALAPAAAAAAGSSSPSRRALAGKPSSSRGEKMVAALMRCFLRLKPSTVRCWEHGGRVLACLFCSYFCFRWSCRCCFVIPVFSPFMISFSCFLFLVFVFPFLVNSFFLVAFFFFFFHMCGRRCFLPFVVFGCFFSRVLVLRCRSVILFCFISLPFHLLPLCASPCVPLFFFNVRHAHYRSALPGGSRSYARHSAGLTPLDGAIPFLTIKALTFSSRGMFEAVKGFTHRFRQFCAFGRASTAPRPHFPFFNSKQGHHHYQNQQDRHQDGQDARKNTNGRPLGQEFRKPLGQESPPQIP